MIFFNLNARFYRYVKSGLIQSNIFLADIRPISQTCIGSGRSSAKVKPFKTFCRLNKKSLAEEEGC